MLSIFPTLLPFTLLGTMLIRIALGGIFILFAIRLFRASRQEGKGRCSQRPLLLLGGACVEGLAGTLLCIGLFTQAAALFIMLLSLDHILRQKQFGPLLKESPLFHALTHVIALALLFLGPGILAFDLPV